MSHLPRRARACLVLVAVLCSVHDARAQNGRDEEDFRVAIGLVRRGLHDDAAQQLRRFLRSHPEHRLAREAWYRLGVCHQELGARGDAVQAFEKAIQGRGPFELLPECRYRLGNTLRELSRHDAARQQYRELVDSVAADHYLRVAALYAEGECLRDLDRHEQALASFTQAAAAAGEDAQYGMPALYQAGFALMKLQRFADASRAFEAAADRYPSHEAAAECRYLEGDTAFRAGDRQRAERALRRAADAPGAFVDDALMGLAWCRLEAGADGEALALFRRVARDHADSGLAAQARLEAGRILYRDGQLDGSLEELQPLVGDGTAVDIRVGALELQGLGLLDKRDAERAAARFQEALQLTGDDGVRARLYFDVGEALAELGEWQQAAAAYAEAESRAGDPDLRGDVLYGRGLALHKLGRFEAALQAVQHLLERHPEHRLVVHARFAVAENQFAMKSYAAADESYRQVPDGHELAPKAAFKRAWCAFLGGDLPTAAARFAALAESEGSEAGLAAESLSMAALAHLNAGALEQALAAADRYRARHPEGEHLARSERVAARVLRQRGDLRGAAARLAVASRAERSADRAADDVLEQAEVLFEQGDFERARGRYGELAERGDRVGARALEGLAWCAFELGDDDTCLARAGAALSHPEVGERRPGLVELQLAALHRAERWDEAVRVAAEFLREFAGHERAREVTFGMGIAHARAGRHRQARQTFAELARTGSVEQPDRLYYELAWACRHDGDEPAALAAFAKVAEIGGDGERTGEAHLHLGLAALGKNDVAAARARFARVEGEHRAQALYRTGFSWLDENELEKARAAFEQILAMGEQQPLYHEALFLAGECDAGLDDHQAAAERYRALLAAAPEHERAQLARLRAGRSLVLTSRAADAAAAIEEYLQRGGGSKTEQAEAHLWLGRARAVRKEHDRAEAAFVEVTRLSDGELGAEAQFRIGEVLRQKGDLDGAVGAFVKLSILYGHEEWVRRGLLQAGLCYEELQQPSKAAKFLRELVERYPKAPESEQARARLQRLRER